MSSTGELAGDTQPDRARAVWFAADREDWSLEPHGGDRTIAAYIRRLCRMVEDACLRTRIASFVSAGGRAARAGVPVRIRVSSLPAWRFGKPAGVKPS